jgi:hypothetical protein
MNRRRINQCLANKFDDWRESIEDKGVREKVEKNSIITGGAIASMLLGEEVHDFDIYFTNFSTALDVAEYYVEKFCAPRRGSGNDKITLPEPHVEGDRIRIRIQSAGIFGEETEVSDYEYFESRPNEEGERFINQAVQRNLSEADEIPADAIDELEKKPYRPVFLTDNAITLSNRVQIVIRFYGDADKIHSNYDFIHCTNYWESSTKKVTLRAEAMESLLSKHLYYSGSKYPVCSIIRLRKFLKRGWHINAGQMLKIMFQVSALDLNDIAVLEDQLTGVDAAYFVQLIDALKQQKSKDEDFRFDEPYLATLVDRIFG